MYANDGGGLGDWSPGQRIPPGWAVSAVMPRRPVLIPAAPRVGAPEPGTRLRAVLAPPPPRPLPARRRGLGASTGPASPGDEVTVGGDVQVLSDRILIRADDTGQTWTVSDTAGTGWVGLAPPYGPITRGAVRGLASGPYLIGRVSAASKYSAGERGTTVVVNAQASQQAAQAAADAPLPQSTLDTLVQQIAVQRYQSPVNVKYWTQFVGAVEAAYAAGRISADDRAFALTMKDDPVKAQQNAYWLPPGGGDVPFILQGAVTDTGAIHPDALTPEAQARTAEVLAYTAKMRGTTYEQEAARLADQVRALNPGETFPGVEKFLEGMQAGQLVQLTPDEATNTFPTVDERSAAERAADPYGVGAGSVYYDLAPAGTPGKGGGGGASSGGLSVAGMNISPTMLALAGLGLFVVTRPTKQTRRRRR